MPEEAVLANRLGRISLGEVHSNERAVRGFPERFGGDGRLAGVERLTVAPGVRQPVAHCIERAQPQLTEALTLEQNPVVVLIRQEIAVECRQVDVDGRARFVLERSPRKSLRLVEVDLDSGIEMELRRGGSDQRVAPATEAP